MFRILWGKPAYFFRNIYIPIKEVRSEAIDAEAPKEISLNIAREEIKILITSTKKTKIEKIIRTVTLSSSGM